MKPGPSGKRPFAHGPLHEALRLLVPSIKQVAFFSFFTNLLVLAPSGYMLEVYDRVVNSRNHRTLLMLTLLVAALYLLLEVLEWVRRQVMHDAGLQLDRYLQGHVFHATFASRLQNNAAVGVQYLKDLKTLREFLSSQAFLSFVDVPFALLVLILIFLMNPFLGWFSLGGAFVQFLIGFINERRVREPLELAGRHAMASQAYANGVIRNAQVIESMGMLDHIYERWQIRQNGFLHHQAQASDYAGNNASLSKMAQGLVSSLLLGFGGFLAIRGELGGSGMIVASILGGRVLSPLVQVIAGWKQVEGFREAFVRLDALFRDFPLPEKTMSLPAPAGALSVEGVIAGPPKSGVQILKGISFRVAPGGTLAIAGPSASGKTTLARLLVGIWPAMSGKVRLDGSDIHAWNKDELGPNIGYLPQNSELFEGSIAENIRRFGAPDTQKVLLACRMVGLESFIDSLPEGIDTLVGDGGAFLSGGERQRVALARAVYGMPKFVVLDEPDASLDQAGDAALLHTIGALKAHGSTVIVITHRRNILSAVEYMLVLADGRIQKSGRCEEVLAALQPETAVNGAVAPVQLAGGAA